MEYSQHSQFTEMFGNETKTVDLSELIEVTFPGEWGKEPTSDSGIKVIRTTNFTNEGKLDLTDVVVRDIDAKKVKRKILQCGDIILERSGGTKENPVGRVVLFEEKGDYLFNNFTQLLRSNSSVNSTYLFYALYNNYNLDKASMRAISSQTTGIQNLNMTEYMSREIKLPPRDLQDQFATIYRQADKSKFDGFKSQFFSLFGDIDASLSLTSICKPKQWKTIPTKDFTESGYLVYGANGIIGKYSQYNHEESTIMIACRGASCGAINVSEPKLYITGNAMCLEDISADLNFEFLRYYLQHYDFKCAITGGAQPQITIQNLLITFTASKGCNPPS